MSSRVRRTASRAALRSRLMRNVRETATSRLITTTAPKTNTNCGFPARRFNLTCRKLFGQRPDRFDRDRLGEKCIDSDRVGVAWPIGFPQSCENDDVGVPG